MKEFVANRNSFLSTINIANTSLFLFIIIFPFSIKVSLLFIFVHYLLTVRSNFIVYSDLNFKRDIIVFSFIAFYLLHLLSLFYCENIQHGLRDVETKMGFIIFPLLALIFPRSDEQQRLFVKTFIVAFTIAALYCIVQSLFKYAGTFDINFLLYDQFSVLMHPTYFTMCLATALVFHLFLILNNDSTKSNTGSYFFEYFILVIILVAIFLTSSRAGIVIALLSVFLLMSGKIVPLKRNKWPVLLTVGLTTMVMILFIMSASSRYNILINEISGKKNNIAQAEQNRVDESPVAHRLTLIKVAFNVAIKHPFGVGVGDVQDILVEEYKRIGYEKAILMKYNPHNQYLQTAVAIGLPGLLLLLLIFYSLFNSIHGNGYQKLLLFVGLIMALNGLFESVLEVQRGVLLLTLMVAFFGRTRDSAIKLETSGLGSTSFVNFAKQ